MLLFISVRRALIYVCAVGFLLIISDLTGLHRHLLERSYKSEFAYPLHVEDFATLVHRYRNNEATNYDPINELSSNLIFMNKADGGCASESYRLIILVKSSPSNFAARDAVRRTWGYAKRFSDVTIKTVFLLGFEKDLDNPLTEREADKPQDSTSKLDQDVLDEISKYNDIVQADFPDSPENSTVKTLMGLRWLTETCSNYRFALFVNDGMYVSVKNLLKFIRHPAEYPEYWEQQKERDQLRINLMQEQDLRLLRTLRSTSSEHSRSLKKRALDNFEIEKSLKMSRKTVLNDLASDADPKDAIEPKTPPVIKKPTRVWKNSPIDFQIDMAEDVILYAGHLIVEGATPRHKIGTNKYLSVSDYPFDQLPPYVSSEAIVLSKPAVSELYYATFFTKYLRLDDVYLGLCSKKMNIEGFHSDYFKLNPSMTHDPYGKKDFKYTITANNFDDPDGLVSFWSAQKSLGNA